MALELERLKDSSSLNWDGFYLVAAFVENRKRIAIRDRLARAELNRDRLGLARIYCIACARNDRKNIADR